MNVWVRNRIFGFAAYQNCQTNDSTNWNTSQFVLKKTRSRMTAVMIVFVLAYGLVAGRMTHLTMTRGETVSADEVASEENQKPVTMRRADILDRTGKLLATSLKTSSLYADPKRILDAAEAARKLSMVFPDLSYDDVYKKLSGKRRFVWLKRNLTPKQIYLANALGLPGIDFIDETRRLYPQGSLTAHVLGYTDIDQKGLAGLERGMDGLLVDADKPLETTLDLRLQHILIKNLQAAIREFNAVGGGGIIMDAHTGEIYAMASLPDFNPHDPEAVPAEDRFNRITLGAYEMGSTFKTFTVAALLERTNAPLMSYFDTRKPLRRYGFTIHDFHPEKHMLSVPEIYIDSSNIGTALMAEKIGTSELKSFFKSAGLMEKPQIEIKELASPLIPNPWREINTITAAYGHGIAVTPLQLTTATAAMINGGTRVTPTLIKRPAEYYASQNPERIISEKTSQTIRDLMRLVVTNGTAKKANAAGYRVGGKTGTAEKTLGRGYSKHAQIASFVAAFPMDNPRFVVMAMVDEPKGNAKSYGFATAGWVSAPIVGNVIKEMAPLVGIMPQTDTRLTSIRSNMGLLPQQQGGRLASY